MEKDQFLKEVEKLSIENRKEIHDCLFEASLWINSAEVLMIGTPLEDCSLTEMKNTDSLWSIVFRLSKVFYDVEQIQH